MRYLWLLLLSGCASAPVVEPIKWPNVCFVCQIIRNSTLVSEKDKRDCTQCLCCMGDKDLCCCRHADTCTYNPTRGGAPCQKVEQD